MIIKLLKVNNLHLTNTNLPTFFSQHCEQWIVTLLMTHKPEPALCQASGQENYFEVCILFILHWNAFVLMHALKHSVGSCSPLGLLSNFPTSDLRLGFFLFKVFNTFFKIKKTQAWKCKSVCLFLNFECSGSGLSVLNPHWLKLFGWSTLVEAV